MRGGILVLVASAVGIAAGCSRGHTAPAAAPAWKSVPEEAVVYSDNSGGIQDSLRLVIRDARALDEIWQRATAGQASPPPVPAVDFSREMALVVAAGRRTPEDQIHVDSVVVRRETNAIGRTEEVMTAMVRAIEGCGRFRADAYPVEIVRVRRFNGPVNFSERRVQAEGCGAGPARSSRR